LKVKPNREDLWERPEGGGGRTRVIENGKFFEKAESIFRQFTGNYEAMQKMFNVGEADFFALT
jgi:coproporphyrinogen III oxidase